MIYRTQSTMILERLRAGDTITDLEAFDLFGCRRLSARIGELRKLGWPILTERVTGAPYPGRRPPVFARYRLDRRYCRLPKP